MSAQRAKGTSAETAVVRWLQDNGFGGAERRVLYGNTDKGDLTGIPGIVWEIKNQARYDIPGWLTETQTEGAAAEADHAVLVVKPKGVGETRVSEWWTVMPLWAMARLLRAAGYGDDLPSTEAQL